MKTVRGLGFKKTTSVDAALNTWIQNFLPHTPTVEQINLEDAVDRILGDSIVSEKNIPPFDKSAMDGYAVKAGDTTSASLTCPVRFKLVGRTPTSGPKFKRLKNFEAIAVSTGSPIPQGSDAVIMVEYTNIDRKYVEVYDTVHPFENIVRTGDDIKAGERILSKGMRLKPYDIGVLKALGFQKVPVIAKPKVGLISTGDELSDYPDEKIYKTVDVNRPILTGLLKEIGAIALDYGITKDEVDIIRERIESTLSCVDMIAVTGGTSVGELDKVPEAINRIGHPGILVHGVSIRPGMPIGLGIVHDKPIISLPGNPVASIVGFLKFIKPAVLGMMKAQEDPSPKVKTKLTRRVVSPPGFKSFVRVSVREKNGILEADPVMTLGSNILSSMVKANGILEVDEDVEGIEEGEWVEVVLYRPIGETK